MNNPIIEKAIEKAGSQCKLAKIAGISQPAIHKLLTGKSKSMSSRTARLISEGTGISLEELCK